VWSNVLPCLFSFGSAFVQACVDFSLHLMTCSGLVLPLRYGMLLK
jgi:hypothetical protein